MVFLNNETEKKEVALRSMPAPAKASIDSLHVFLLTALSAYARLRPTEALETLQHGDNDDLQYFIASLGQYIISATSVKALPLTMVPTWAWVLACFLKPKSKLVGTALINYTAEWPNLTYTLPASYNLSVGTSYWTQGAGSSATTETLASVNYVLDDEKYLGILRTTQETTDRFKQTRPSDSPMPNSWQNDPSAYARSYTYFGTGGTPGIGLYNNSELEVPINFPLFSRFVEYGVDDLAISRHFAPMSGGPSNVAGMMLSRDDFNFKHLRNRIPTVYKFIDFWEIFAAFAGHLALLMSSIVDEGGPIKRQTLPFGAMDFAVMVRQAVLSEFTEQAESQFVAPYAYAGTGSYTTFQPFLVDPICLPAAVWTETLVSNLLKSNLSFLREYIHFPTSKKYGTVNKRNFIRYVPVIGVYKDDVPPTFNIANLNGSGTTPLFGPNVVATSPFSIADMRLTNGTQKYNPNHKQFVAVMNSWNSTINFLASFTTGVGQIATDVAPKTNLLTFTRQLDESNPLFEKEKEELFFPVIPSLYDKLITGYENRSTEKFSKTKNDKKIPPVGAPSAATLSTITTVGLHSCLDVSTEVKTILDMLILPSIRLSSLSSTEPRLTLRQYKTYTGEMHQTSYNAGYQPAGRFQDKRLLTMMGSAVLAQGGTILGENDLTKAIRTMEEEGLGGDLLGALLGGLLSSVPVIGPIAGAFLNAM